MNPPDDEALKEAWIRRFAVAVFLANRKISWTDALGLGLRFWRDFGSVEPEDVAKIYMPR